MITLTPLDSVSMVVPKISSFFSETIYRLSGLLFIKGSLDAVYIRSSFSDFTSFRRFLISSSVGSFKPSFSGPNKATTWLLSVTICCIIWFRAVTGMAGAIWLMIVYSLAIPGIGSLSRKWRTYSLRNSHFAFVAFLESRFQLAQIFCAGATVFCFGESGGGTLFHGGWLIPFSIASSLQTTMPVKASFVLATKKSSS